MLSQVIDLTADFADGSSAVIDASNWDYIIVQLVTPSGTINFTASNDSGDVQAISDGNSLTSTNFTAVQATNLATGTAVASSAASGLFKFNVVGRYIKVAGNGGSETIAKLLVFYSKIS